MLKRITSKYAEVNNNEHIQYLMQRYLTGKHDPKELKELLNYFNQPEDNSLLRSMIQAQLAKEPLDDEIHLPHITEMAEKVEKNILARTKTRQPKSSFNWLYAAATLLFTFAATLYFYNGLQQKNENTIKSTIDVEPGGNKAVLTISNGKKFDLDTSQSGIIINNAGIRYNDGQSILTQEMDDQTLPANSQLASEKYNSVSTPRGGQYQIILPDGTKVWLNAGSSLKYPTRFGNHERTVEISGEAFFEVKEDKTKPFKVMSMHQTLEVLGTSFNISAFDDEPSIATTLITGAVKISSQKAHLNLIPGEQSCMQQDGKITKNAVNTENSIAWIHGDFIFSEEEIPAIMRRISRWYNIQVVYESPMAHTKYVGQISRSKKLTAILHILQTTGGIHYRIAEDGKTLYIKN